MCTCSEGEACLKCPAINIRQTGAVFSKLTAMKISYEGAPPEIRLIIVSTMLGINQKTYPARGCETAS